MTHVFTDTIAKWPTEARTQFNAIRTVILAAAEDANAGPLTESLKWRQPAWRPARPNQGSTLRLNWHPNAPTTLALFVDCKTTLSETMQDIYPTDFTYESSRSLHMPISGNYPTQAIDHLARLTFTYHRKP